MNRYVVGLETEYGVLAAGADANASRRIVDEATAGRVLSRRAGFLANGGRLYHDVGDHPEWATPECTDARTAVVYDRVGELLMREAAAAVTSQWREKYGPDAYVTVLKDNCDTGNAVYACHENYQAERDSSADFESFIDRFVPFLVSRTILTGTGRVEQTDSGRWRYVLSQRAHALEAVASGATTTKRPLVSTRDEPHADGDRWRRLHVTLGDSNRNDVATWLKLEVTGLVARALQVDRSAGGRLTLDDPVGVLRAISSDLSFRRTFPTQSGTRMSALDLQRAYLDLITSVLDRDTVDDHTDALERWSGLLDALESDSIEGVGRVCDWAAKLVLIDRMRVRDGASLGSDKVRSLTVAYHDLRADVDVFARLTAAGHVDTLIGDDEVRDACDVAPAGRARIRGRFIAAAIASGVPASADWALLCLDPPGERVRRTHLPDPLAGQVPRAAWLTRLARTWEPPPRPDRTL